MGCSGLRQQNSAYKYRYRMGSWRTARIRRTLGSSIPPNTARIICESPSLKSYCRFCRNLCATPMPLYLVTSLYDEGITTANFCVVEAASKRDIAVHMLA